MKQSPLHDQHLKLGATVANAAGWEMPLHYGDVETEYAAVRHHVGIADLTHRGRVTVTGDDRAKWLQSIVSNDILPLIPGQGLYSGLLNHKGRMLSYFRVYAMADAYLLEDVGEIGNTTVQTLRKFLLYGTKARLENSTANRGLLLVSGPQAIALLKAAFGADVSHLSPLSFIVHPIAGQQALLIRTEETGETDFELWIPAEGLRAAWDQLWAAGHSLGLKPFGTQAREILRIEAGLPRAGLDLTEDIVPPEANLEGKAFSLSKGCYPGQEVMARMDTYGSVRRRLVGLVLKESVVPPKGAKLFSGEREIGWISSAVRSPYVGSVIALGFPLRDFTTPGTALTVDVNGQRYDATVQALPFYARR